MRLALDLFCGGGGAALGLQRAGYSVVGIDIEDHSAHYPGEFVQANALKPPVDLRLFDFVWASPPCQKFSVATPKDRKDVHDDLIADVREMLSGHPYTCIENVKGAPIRRDMVLTAPMFGLEQILRERHFEISWPVLSPPLIGRNPKYKHKWLTITTSLCSKGHADIRRAQGLPIRVPVAEACAAMGIDIPMSRVEVGNAIPPAYAEYIGTLAYANSMLVKPTRR